MAYIEEFKEIWLLATLVIGGIGGLIKWKSRQRVNAEKEIDMLSALKERVIKQITKEVKDSDKIAQQEMLLNKLKLVCPECYEKVMKNVK